MAYKVFDFVRIAIYVAVLSLIIIIPLEAIESRSICIFYNWFGIRCFGCGATRAMANLLRGDILRAWQYNCYAVVLSPIMAGVVINDVYCIIRRHFCGVIYTKRSLVDIITGRS